PAPRFVHAIETIEDARQVFRRNADAGVADHNPAGVPLAVTLDLDRSPLRRVLDGIVEQVVKNLAQASFVAADANPAWHALSAERRAWRCAPAVQHACRRV